VTGDVQMAMDAAQEYFILLISSGASRCGMATFTQYRGFLEESNRDLRGRPYWRISGLEYINSSSLGSGVNVAGFTNDYHGMWNSAQIAQPWARSLLQLDIDFPLSVPATLIGCTEASGSITPRTVGTEEATDWWLAAHGPLISAYTAGDIRPAWELGPYLADSKQIAMSRQKAWSDPESRGISPREGADSQPLTLRLARSISCSRPRDITSARTSTFGGLGPHLMADAPSAIGWLPSEGSAPERRTLFGAAFAVVTAPQGAAVANSVFGSDGKKTFHVVVQGNAPGTELFELGESNTTTVSYTCDMFSRGREFIEAGRKRDICSADARAGTPLGDFGPSPLVGHVSSREESTLDSSLWSRDFLTACGTYDFNTEPPRRDEDLHIHHRLSAGFWGQPTNYSRHLNQRKKMFAHLVAAQSEQLRGPPSTVEVLPRLPQHCEWSSATGAAEPSLREERIWGLAREALSSTDYTALFLSLLIKIQELNEWECGQDSHLFPAGMTSYRPDIVPELEVVPYGTARALGPNQDGVLFLQESVYTNSELATLLHVSGGSRPVVTHSKSAGLNEPAPAGRTSPVASGSRAALVGCVRHQHDSPADDASSSTASTATEEKSSRRNSKLRRSRRIAKRSNSGRARYAASGDSAKIPEYILMHAHADECVSPSLSEAGRASGVAVAAGNEATRAGKARVNSARDVWLRQPPTSDERIGERASRGASHRIRPIANRVVLLVTTECEYSGGENKFACRAGAILNDLYGSRPLRTADGVWKLALKLARVSSALDDLKRALSLLTSAYMAHGHGTESHTWRRLMGQIHYPTLNTAGALYPGQMTPGASLEPNLTLERLGILNANQLGNVLAVQSILGGAAITAFNSYVELSAARNCCDPSLGISNLTGEQFLAQSVAYSSCGRLTVPGVGNPHPDCPLSGQRLVHVSRKDLGPSGAMPGYLRPEVMDLCADFIGWDRHLMRSGSNSVRWKHSQGGSDHGSLEWGMSTTPYLEPVLQHISSQIPARLRKHLALTHASHSLEADRDGTVSIENRGSNYGQPHDSQPTDLDGHPVTRVACPKAYRDRQCVMFGQRGENLWALNSAPRLGHDGTASRYCLEVPSARKSTGADEARLWLKRCAEGLRAGSRGERARGMRFETYTNWPDEQSVWQCSDGHSDSSSTLSPVVRLAPREALAPAGLARWHTDYFGQLPTEWDDGPLAANEDIAAAVSAVGQQSKALWSDEESIITPVAGRDACWPRGVDLVSRREVPRARSAGLRNRLTLRNRAEAAAIASRCRASAFRSMYFAPTQLSLDLERLHVVHSWNAHRGYTLDFAAEEQALRPNHRTRTGGWNCTPQAAVSCAKPRTPFHCRDWRSGPTRSGTLAHLLARQAIQGALGAGQALGTARHSGEAELTSRALSTAIDHLDLYPADTLTCPHSPHQSQASLWFLSWSTIEAARRAFGELAGAGQRIHAMHKQLGLVPEEQPAGLSIAAAGGYTLSASTVTGLSEDARSLLVSDAVIGDLLALQHGLVGCTASERLEVNSRLETLAKLLAVGGAGLDRLDKDGALALPRGSLAPISPLLGPRALVEHADAPACGGEVRVHRHAAAKSAAGLPWLLPRLDQIYELHQGTGVGGNGAPIFRRAYYDSGGEQKRSPVLTGCTSTDSRHTPITTDKQLDASGSSATKQHIKSKGYAPRSAQSRASVPSPRQGGGGGCRPQYRVGGPRSNLAGARGQWRRAPARIMASRGRRNRTAGRAPMRTDPTAAATSSAERKRLSEQAPRGVRRPQNQGSPHAASASARVQPYTGAGVDPPPAPQLRRAATASPKRLVGATLRPQLRRAASASAAGGRVAKAAPAWDTLARLQAGRPKPPPSGLG
jgi:hypothetical protein